MSDFTKDVIIGTLIIAGVWSFISGQFIISTLVFGTSALFSNIVTRSAQKQEKIK